LTTILLLGLPSALRPAITAALAANAAGDSPAGPITCVWQLDPARPVITQIADMQPSLIVIGTGDLPAWIADLRSNPATRRMPTLAVGDQLDAARALGITDGLHESDLLAGLPAALLTRLKLPPDLARLADACAEPLPARALQGIAEFNAGHYFEAHETLEHAWNDATGPIREVYRAILQVAVAYYQIERGNYNGAYKMFLRMVQWFAPLPDRCQGVDIARLKADAAAVRAHLEQLGPERIAAFDRNLLRPVQVEPATPG
jgi:predicted metal-dependent hydrolase